MKTIRERKPATLLGALSDIRRVGPNVRTVILGMLCLPALPHLAFAGQFLEIDSIPGDAVTAGHEADIDILAWSWDVVTATGSSAGSGRRRAQTCASDIELTKLTDSASAPLLMNQLTGRVVPEAVLTVTKSAYESGSTADYLTLTLSNVMVTGFSTGSTDADGTVLERVRLSYESLTFAYTAMEGNNTAEATYSGAAACNR